MFCGNCGRNVPNQYNTCPYCGYPLIQGMQPPQKQSKNPLYIGLIVAAAILVACAIAGVVIFFTYKSKNSGKEAITQTQNNQSVGTASQSASAPAPTPTPTSVPTNQNPVSYVEEKVCINYADATSYLITQSQDGQTYEPQKVIDGNYKTAWIEGRDDLGIGESIVLHFGETERITRMLIYNGFLNTKYRYAINGKVTQIRVEFDDGTVIDTFPDVLVVPEEKVPFEVSEMWPTEILLDQPISASSVRLTILNAEGGSKYDDVAISEVEIYHEVEAEMAATAVSTGAIDDDIIQAYADFYERNSDPLMHGSTSVSSAYIDEDDIPEIIVKEVMDLETYSILHYENGTVYAFGYYESICFSPRNNDVISMACDGATSEDLHLSIVGNKMKPVEGVTSTYEDDNQTHYYILDSNKNKTEVSENDYDLAYATQRKYDTYIYADKMTFYDSVEEAMKH